MAIAEHAPDKLYAQNKSMLKMSQGQLHDYASTKGLGAPKPPKLAKTGGLIRKLKSNASGLTTAGRKSLGGGT